MPRPTLPPLSRSPSSSTYLARQSRDPHVRAAVSANLRARSAFKLVQLADKYPTLLRKGMRVVDLGAAPGGWSQIALQKVGPKGLVISLDLLPIAPFPSHPHSSHIMQGDALSPPIQKRLRSLLFPAPSANAAPPSGGHERYGLLPTPEPSPKQGITILSDMMANMSGLRARDVEASLELCEMALGFAERVMGAGEGGNLVMKHFAHPLLTEFKKTRLDGLFERVCFEKPEASRKESSEGYFVCLGMKSRSESEKAGAEED